ncbi:MAG: HypC/HybG/HupF family hydrogenase formation chaperone [Candidatus Binataceae bacterium]
MSQVLKASECHAELCITCSDLAVEARVIELLGDDLARVAIEDETEVISIALVDARPGDLLLVHAREAIAKIIS